MVQIKKSIQLSALLVLCQSPYFICIVTSSSSKDLLSKVPVLDLLKINLTTLLNQSQSPSSHSHKNKHYIPSAIKEIKQEEFLMCETILSQENKHLFQQHSNNKNTSYSNFQIIIPINSITICSLSLLFILIILGSFYVWKIFTVQKCYCPLCREEYEIIDKLGEGGFGEIYKVKYKNSFYILKRCKLDNIAEADDLLLEAKHLRTLSHKNIVKFHDDFLHIEYQHGQIEPSIYVVIIMEYCESGDLKNLIDTRFYAENPFTKEEIIGILIQLCEGLSYLHSKNIMHRDIKSQNIFFTNDHIVRIGDFGLAKKIRKKNLNTNMSKVGTENYMAPEVIRNSNYGLPVDMWSLGCVICEMCTLTFVWQYEATIGVEALTSKEFLQPLLNDITDEKGFDFFKEILKDILTLNPDVRMTIDVLLFKLRKENKKMNHKKIEVFKHSIPTIL